MTTASLGPSALPHQQADTWDLRAYIRILRARKTALFGLSSTILLAVAIVTFAMRPVYRATSLLLIEPKGINVAKVDGVYDPTLSGTVNDYYKTQFEILRSRRIIDPVAATFHIPERPEFSDERDPIEAFIGAIGIEPIRESRLVRVSVESHDKAFATDAANSIVQQFVDENNQRSLGLSDTGLKKLKEMERSLRPKYESAARALQEFKDSSGIYFLDESQSIAVQQLKVLSEELSKARADRAKATAESKTAGASLRDGQIEGDVPQFLPSKALDDLKVELARVEQDRDDLLRHYTSDHPAVKAAVARVERLREHIDVERKNILATLDKRLTAEDGRVAELERAVATAEANVADIGRKAVRLQFLKEEADTVAASYKNVAKRIEEVEVAIATGTKENNLFVIDRAMLPKQPQRPKKLFNLVAGTLFGLLCGFGFCLLLEYLDQTIKGKEDAERLLEFPVLGFVPRVEKEELEAAEPGQRIPIELVAVHHPRGRVAEAFRTIRTGLSFTLPSGGTSIVVTSATPGDGKSFVSVNLGHSLAQAGKRVLLIDADLRRPRLHDIFGFGETATGLSTAIVPGSTPALDTARTTSVPMLDVLPAGPLPPNPAELLAGPALKALLDLARARYDWVILDAPPLTAVADPAILLANVAHAVFVIRSFTTLKQAALRAKEILVRTGGATAGIVLNTVDVPASNHGDHYDRYGRYGGYYAHERTQSRRDEARALIDSPAGVGRKPAD